ncbi:MAG TPA: hypothetical protein VNK95_10945 [Caldilineaceae bacterium]|nr:hypothetical protein [Caldilineaceae bacterium]
MQWTLTPVPPFRLELPVWGLRRRPINSVDCWETGAWQRVLLVEGRPLLVTVVQTGPVDAAQLAVSATGDLRSGDEQTVKATVAHMLDIHRDLTGFYTLAAQDAILSPLAARFRGLRAPQFANLYETLVNTIACQQVTLGFGLTMLNRLAAAYGPGVETPSGPLHALPSPEILAGIPLEELRGLQFSGAKARALHEVAIAQLEGRLDAQALAALDDDQVIANLTRLWGVGRWTAEVALLRGLGRLTRFPGDDVGARNRLRRFLGLSHPLDYAATQAIVARWQPYSGLLYFLMLFDRLAAEGVISSGPLSGPS